MLVPSNMDFAVLSSAIVPSRSSILLSFVASICLLWVFRLAFLWATSPSGSIQEKQRQCQKTKLSSWGILTWESLPDCPISLTVSPRDTMGRGVGLGVGVPLMGPQKHSLKTPQVPQTAQVNWQPPRGRQTVQQSTSQYNSQVPVSMAKMIMSRHTFRRPAQPAPRPPQPPRSMV
ncbi:hypothetical protein C8J56DRAFT_428295 [Mycena floridula]|nr:hypothetical protein C8J56DRAFT_428295 [Mycena floridula]